MSRETWSINAQSAVSEIIDEELVVMNMTNGNYYNSTGIGSFIWACVEQRVDCSAMTDAIVAKFGVTREVVDGDVRRFLGELEKETLIVQLPDGLQSGAVPDIKDREYSSPQLQVFSDMKDLLLLDPIHDVGETGWPVRPTEQSA
jgi:hypothetical protein